KKVVLVLANENKNVYLSAQNIENAKVVLTSGLNTYTILDNKALVLCESSVAAINNF
ncbi:MAG: 50S ribosomal protein L4, partial [Candidatus Limisoma sp.]